MAKILWADDEIDSLKPHIIFLKNKAHDVTAVNSGNEAIEEFKKESFDIVFLDENMPGMNGLEFIGKVKEDDRLQLIPVVVMTTSSLNSDVRSAYKQLANAVVVKPIEFEDYIKTITAIHTFWLSTAKIARYE